MGEAVIRYFAPLRCRALVNIAQFSKLTSWGGSSRYTPNFEGSISASSSQSCGRVSPVSQLLASRCWPFRRQPIFHVCGNAKLCCFSDGFGSLQSGRQLFGLCQSLGCPGSPIVTIEIVAHQFCHVIVLTVAPSGRCAPGRWHWTSSGRCLPEPRG